MNRTLSLTLLALLLFVSSGVAAKPQSWKDQAQTAIMNGDYKTATELYVKWTDADPTDAVSLYNLACCHAILKDPDAALVDLRKAAEAGWSDSSHTAEDPDLASLHSKPDFNKDLSQIALNGRERHGGFLLHMAPQERWGQYLVVLPAEYNPNQKYPLVILLHGYGQSPETFAENAALINSHDFIYAVPQGPYVALDSDGKGYSHLRERDDYSEDPRTAAKSADWVVSVADDMAKRYRLEGSKFWLVGFSQGAALAHITAAMHPDRVAGYTAHGGYIVKNTIADSMLAAEKSAGVKVLITHGKDDPAVSYNEGVYSSAMLKQAGLDVTFVEMEVPHVFNSEVASKVNLWLTQRIVKQ